jgi:arginyl-tRNA--protein-N-Asp/Glu arginylyltransferase
MGYAICYKNNQLFQYAYPFYLYEKFQNNYGMGMMLSAISYAKENGLKYIYLGSVTRETDLYKLQFKGREWYDENSWQTEKLEELKLVIQNFSKN